MRAGPICPTLCRHESCVRLRKEWFAADPGMLIEIRKPPKRTSDQILIGWLLKNVQAIAQDEAAGAIHHDMQRLAERVERAVDNHDPAMFCGPCVNPAVQADLEQDVITIRIDADEICGAELWCEVGDSEVICPRCGRSYPVREIKDRMLDMAKDQWVRPPAAVDFLRAYGEDITLDRVKMWISRDKAEHDAGRTRRVAYPPILQVGIDDDTRPLFRLGDFADRLDWFRQIEIAKKESA